VETTVRKGTEDGKAKQGTLMTHPNELHISGGVNVHAIESELRTLWEQMAETTQAEGQQPVMRACVLNLMVYMPDEHATGEVSQIMAEVTTQHPSRIFVILPTSRASESPLSAWVTALCHLSAGGHKQVCCEQIMITAENDAVDRLPSLVRSLLVPDVPVVLWWRDVPRFESPVFADLTEASDRVIIDSEMLPSPEEGLAELAAIIEQRPQWTAFSDLSWARLTPWRVSVAGFFDTPEWGAYLARLNRVEIECASHRDDERSIPSQALLIASWLASRLKWRSISKPRWSGRNTYHFKLASAKLPIEVQIKTTPSAGITHGRLNAIRLSTEGKPSGQFVVSRSGEDGYLRTEVELAGAKLAGKVIPLGDRNEAHLISKELEILDHDAMLEQALAFFASIPQ
jgi:glucose-6-phosphate dehydrogenase assembly protein OpcA